MEHDLLGLLTMKVQYTPAHIKCMMKQITEGLYYLHQKNVIHRDLKTANILLNNKGELKLADFGLARFTNAYGLYTYRVVTLWYRAPELLFECKKYTSQIDMWSLGCIFAELLLGYPLFQGKNEQELLEKIYEKCGGPDDSTWPDVSRLPMYTERGPKKQYMKSLAFYMKSKIPNIDEHSLNLLDRLLVLNPDKRMTAKEALEHPYFSSDPLPCEPHQLPKVEKECHEKLHREKTQQLRNQKNPNPNLNDNNVLPGRHPPRQGGANVHDIVRNSNPYHNGSNNHSRGNPSHSNNNGHQGHHKGGDNHTNMNGNASNTGRGPHATGHNRPNGSGAGRHHNNAESHGNNAGGHHSNSASRTRNDSGPRGVDWRNAPQTDNPLSSLVNLTKQREQMQAQAASGPQSGTANLLLQGKRKAEGDVSGVDDGVDEEIKKKQRKDQVRLTSFTKKRMPHQSFLCLCFLAVFIQTQNYRSPKLF
eukprot:TRINITY_DN1502_c0_g1_i2.p2 TRINITY_DN1502_c0_g1~~TRINITY_DN1502_c0_g1_i2.p2  ORF type:complete len:476 (+),score=45.85 TRINITY_DN1502_c0_g1_i2:492-1919(+)